MTRKKVTLAYIANDSARKATFKKRKKGLMKKVSELSTLCGIEACAIVYSPYDTEPEMWPSPVGARRAIARFRNMPEMDQSKRMMNQQNFLRQRIWKVEEQLKKQHRENREKEVTQVMYRGLIRPEVSLQGLSLMDLNDLNWVLDKTVKEIEDKVKSLQKTPPPQNNSNHRASQTQHVSAGNAHCTNKHHGNIITKSEYQNLGPEKGIGIGIGGVLDLGIDALQNPPWYMELLKPAEGLLGFSRFNNNNYNNNVVNNNDMMTIPPPPPPPPAASTTTTTYPCPGQNGVPWSNFFFP